MKLIHLIIFLIIMQSTSAKENITSTIIYKYYDQAGVLNLTTIPPQTQDQILYARSYLIPPFSPIKIADRTYSTLIQTVAQKTALPIALLQAIVEVESNYNANAISPKGAVGLMQLMPATAKRFGVADRTHPESNLMGGATYLRYLLTLFNHDLSLTLAAYNAGEKAVKRYHNTIPPYRETINYVKKVKQRYYQLSGEIP